MDKIVLKINVIMAFIKEINLQQNCDTKLVLFEMNVTASVKFTWYDFKFNQISKPKVLNP